jgi:hypothetical protein
MVVKAESQSDVETTVGAQMTSTRLVKFIRLTQPAANHLCFSWLACYDQAGKNVCAERNQFTSAGGGTTPHPDPWGLSAPVLSAVENSGQQGGNAYCSATAPAGNWWQVDLGGLGVDIKQIKYRTRNDSPSYGFNIQITLWDKVCDCAVAACIRFGNLTCLAGHETDRRNRLLVHNFRLHDHRADL